MSTIVRRPLIAYGTTEGRGDQSPYDEDFHFYRDLDPTAYPGTDTVANNYKALILKKGDVPGGSR